MFRQRYNNTNSKTGSFEAKAHEQILSEAALILILMHFRLEPTSSRRSTFLSKPTNERFDADFSISNGNPFVAALWRFGNSAMSSNAVRPSDTSKISVWKAFRFRTKLSLGFHGYRSAGNTFHYYFFLFVCSEWSFLSFCLVESYHCCFCKLILRYFSIVKKIPSR